MGGTPNHTWMDIEMVSRSESESRWMSSPSIKGMGIFSLAETSSGEIEQSHDSVLGAYRKMIDQDSDDWVRSVASVDMTGSETIFVFSTAIDSALIKDPDLFVRQVFDVLQARMIR